jgi:aminoglycoside 6'-N-acetyltransferase
MMTNNKYDFRRVTMKDLPTLLQWQSQPHVREWWGSSEPYDQDELSDPRVSRWIVCVNENPFAFTQDYTVHGWGDHHFSRLPKGARGLDQYIGDPDMIGIGHGTAFIAARMQSLFENGVPVLATDPHPDNDRAIAVYKRLGFVPAGEPQETQWGRILPMLARP